MKKQGLSPAMVPQYLAQHPHVAQQWHELQQQALAQQAAQGGHPDMLELRAVNAPREASTGLPFSFGPCMILLEA